MKSLIISAVLLISAITTHADSPPVSKLTKEQAVAIADKKLSDKKRFQLLDLQWHLVSSFKPTQDGGLDFRPQSHSPGEYAWFATYSIIPDPAAPKRTWRPSILVLQISDEGVAESVAGFKW
jgi:hypothetical protein